MLSNTSTGDITKRRGFNVLKDPTLIVTIALLFLCFCYATWYFLINEGKQGIALLDKEGTDQTVQVPSKANERFFNPIPSNDSGQTDTSKHLSLDLPYGAESIRFNGFVGVTLNKDKKYKQYLFTLKLKGDEFSLSDSDLQYFGIKVHYINECAVELSSGKRKRVVYCPPKIKSKTDARQKSSLVSDAVSSI